MKVFLVLLCGEYYDGGDSVAGVFSTKELAKQYVKHEHERHKYNDYDIQPWDVIKK